MHEGTSHENTGELMATADIRTKYISRTDTVTIQFIQIYITRNVAPGLASPLIKIAITAYNYDDPQQSTRNGSLTDIDIDVASMPTS